MIEVINTVIALLSLTIAAASLGMQIVIYIEETKNNRRRSK